jgi:hypothetical protein
MNWVLILILVRMVLQSEQLPTGRKRRYRTGEILGQRMSGDWTNHE